MDSASCHAKTRARLKVCLQVPYDLAYPGGVRHHILGLAQALRRGGDEVILVGPSSQPGKTPGVCSFGGVVNIHGNGSDNRLALLASPFAVSKFFRDTQFDIVHAHEPLLPALNYWAIWGSPRIPRVATFHAYVEDEARALTLARKLSARLIFSRFQRGIAVSEAAARYAARAWNRPLSIIPNGISVATFHPRETPAVESQDVRLLFVGRLAERKKGGPEMFAAYRELVGRKIPVTLDVVGELGEAQPPPDLPGLRYHGAVGFDSLLELYQRADIFVAPSTGQESFGIVLLEAMACGLPVVCSDIDGYRQTVNRGGAILVPPSDPSALAAGIERMVQLSWETRRSMGESNRRAALAYDWDVVAGRVRAEYVAAIEERQLLRA